MGKARVTKKRSKRRRISKPLGILCIEGDFDSGLEQPVSITSATSLLSIMDVKVITRHASTKAEFKSIVRDWLKGHAHIPICYIVSHGQPGAIILDRNSREVMTFVELANLIDSVKSKTRRVLYFSACSTLKTKRSQIEPILDCKKIAAICGYTKDVLYIEAVAYELIQLWQLSLMSHASPAAIGKAIDETDKRVGALGKQLGAECWY